MITYTKGNGTSKRSAIKIIGGHGEFDGIDSEYKLVSLIFKIIKKDWTLLQQELYLEGDRAYDRLIIEDEDGKVSDIFFDISAIFGRF
jgi:hypothetical protein